jgi:uncharacterized membrane protein
MDILMVFFEGIQIILGFFLVLFVPGFAITFVFFPHLADIRLTERLVYSLVLSIGSVIILVLFMDSILGIYTTQKNITLIICAFSVFALVLWQGERQCEKIFGNRTSILKPYSMLSNNFPPVRSYGKKIMNFICSRIGIK